MPESVFVKSVFYKFFWIEVLDNSLYWNSCISRIHKVIRYCVVSLAIWILVAHIISYIITVSHSEKILGEVRISRGNEILHIHFLYVWTKPARLWNTIDLIIFEFAADFIHTRKLFQTANSFYAFLILSCLRITKLRIPVLSDVENTIGNNIYRGHCLIDCHVKSIILLILNVAVIHSLVELFIYKHWINHLEE